VLVGEARWHLCGPDLHPSSLLFMSIQPYVGPNPGSDNGAIVAIGTAQEITPEEYERRQKEVICSSNLPGGTNMATLVLPTGP
jgi:hypothetical protein